MACNENVIKNMAKEISRNCLTHSLTVDPEFVIYLIEIVLLNPKYGRLFAKTINRDKLAYFVNVCVKWLKDSSTPLNMVKMQFNVQMNYDKLSSLIEKHEASIDNCLKPLINEILEVDPGDEAELKKLFRKISIYIILASGLGNPGHIITLKEGMAALESVFGMDNVKAFVALSRSEKVTQLNDLLGIVSGVRLFNRDCKKGGECIPDLPCNLVDAGKASLASLSNSLIAVMQRVNKLTTAIEDSIAIEEETGNVFVDIKNPDLNITDYNEMFDILAFYRQYEIYIRRVLADVKTMTEKGAQYVDRFRSVLEELHKEMKYKAAVPVASVYPLFVKLWQAWRSMQDAMFLMSKINRLMSILDGIQEQIKPSAALNKMLEGKTILSDHDRMSYLLPSEDKIWMGSLHSFAGFSRTSQISDALRKVEFLGFCAMCLNVGALVPSKIKIGHIKFKGRSYGFCSAKMALRFSKDPERYINVTLDQARLNPQLIHLLNILDNVNEVKDIENLVIKKLPKAKVFEKSMQTELHPMEEFIEKDYSSNLWDWKKRACQWASIVKCKTHSTQTHYSHLRSDTHCQTTEPRDKGHQTKRDTAVNTDNDNGFLWGLRGRVGYGQHVMDLRQANKGEGLKAVSLSVCTQSKLDGAGDSKESTSTTTSDEEFYHPYSKPEI